MSSYYKKLTFRYQSNVYENGKLKTCIYDKTEKTEKNRKDNDEAKNVHIPKIQMRMS